MNGYKTYIASAATLLWALYGLWSHNLDVGTATQLIAASAIGAALRHGISTTGN